MGCRLSRFDERRRGLLMLKCALPVLIGLSMMVWPPMASAEEPQPAIRTGKVGPEGAVVCRTPALVAFMSTQLRQGAGFPDFKRTRCALLLEGATVTVEQTERGPMVTPETMLGRPSAA